MESVKQVLKRVTPEGAKDIYRRTVSAKEGMVAFSYDRRRFSKYHAKRTWGRVSQVQVEAKLVFHAHAVEKGLSHQIVRLGFGRSALRALANNMKVYTRQGYSRDGEAYLNALSVLKAYVELHEIEDYEVPYLNELFTSGLLEEARCATSTLGGVSVVGNDSKANNRNANYKELFNNRWSVREYSDTPVDKADINEVIEIARKAPSICNRQSSRATVIYDKAMVAAALKIQGGITGYKTPPALIMVTTDTSAFVDVNERNQVYIDGGLYAMSILMGLEYVSLAACSLNAMMTVKDDKKMRKLLRVPASENIIMFISVGNFLSENKVPKSFRYATRGVKREI